MPFLNDLVTVIENQSVATYGVNLFISPKAAIPHVPSGVVHIIDTGGTSPDETHNSVTPAYLQPSAQISVRADDEAACDHLISQVFYALTQVRNQFVNGSWYVWIKAVQQPFHLNVDERNVVKKVFNVIARYNRRESL